MVAAAWVAGTQAAARRIGWIEPSEERLEPASRARRGLRASTRMAVQMGAALVLAYVLGRWLFPDHWTWLLLSCYVTGAGNRGRGDVVHKGIGRLAGALAGTATATLVAEAFDPGDRAALALLFVVMAVAVWARGYGYAYWAAGVTAMTALLQGYYGAGGLDMLSERVLGIALGSLSAVAAAWFLVPVRSRDVFRLRWAAALALTGDLLAALCSGEGVDHARRRLAGAVAELELGEPAYVLHRRTVGRITVPRGQAHPAELVALLREVAHALDDVATLPASMQSRAIRLMTAWTRDLGAVRRRMRPGVEEERSPRAETGNETLDRATRSLGELDAAFTREVWTGRRRV